jgi:hypothetical protein
MGKTVYLNTDNASLRPQGEALRVLRPGKSESLIPLQRIDRAVVEHSASDLLQAFLAIVQRGGTVHFQDAAGNLCGILQYPWSDGTHWAREIAHAIEHTTSRASYRRWLDTQRRHAWSLVFRRNFSGDFEANRKRLIRYLLFFRPEIDISGELEWLEKQLWAWLQARLDQDGLRPIVRAFKARREHLAQDLAPCLFMPLLWAFVRWRRHQSSAIVSERTHFFELQARIHLHNQFQRHIQALEVEFTHHAQYRVDEANCDDLAESSHSP